MLCCWFVLGRCAAALNSMPLLNFNQCPVLVIAAGPGTGKSWIGDHLRSDIVASVSANGIAADAAVQSMLANNYQISIRFGVEDLLGSERDMEGRAVLALRCLFSAFFSDSQKFPEFFARYRQCGVSLESVLSCITHQLSLGEETPKPAFVTLAIDDVQFIVPRSADDSVGSCSSYDLSPSSKYVRPGCHLVSILLLVDVAVCAPMQLSLESVGEQLEEYHAYRVCIQSP